MIQALRVLQLLGLVSVSLLAVAGAESYTYTYKTVGFTSSTVPKKMKPKVSLVSGDQFGYAVAVWNTKAIVSASKVVAMDDGSVGAGGVVYMFYQNTKSRDWYDSGLQFITPYGMDGFGASIAIWDTTVAVGAPLLSNVYIYSGTNYQTKSEISPREYEEYDYFGHSVAVVHGKGYYSSSGAVVVGAYGHSENKEHQNTGSVFVYALDSSMQWQQVSHMQPSRVQPNGYFGYSVSTYGNTIAVGAPGSESVFLFSMEGHYRECPHEGHDMPSGCEGHHRQLRRALQGGGEGGEGGKEGEDREREDREREEREQQHHYYMEWAYREEMEIVGSSDEQLGFGTTVAVYNNTVLTVAIGSVYDYQSTSASAAGAVYVVSQVNEGDVINSWHPTDYFPEHEHHRALQGGGEHDRHNEQRYWPIKLASYTSDKLDNYWMLETVIHGSTIGEQFGHSLAVEYDTLLIGNHPQAQGDGRVEVHSRVASAEAKANSPLYQGPLYKTTWKLSTTLTDMFGGSNDMFGGSVGLYKSIAVVGSYLTGFEASSNTIGTGAAYIYDKVQVTATLVEEEAVATGTPVVNDNMTGLMKSLTMASFAFIVAVVSSVCGFVAYKVTQRKIKEGSFDSFYKTLGWVRVEEGSGIKSLSDIDSSTSSQHSMLSSSQRSNYSSASSNSGSGSGPVGYARPAYRAGGPPPGGPTGVPTTGGPSPNQMRQPLGGRMQQQVPGQPPGMSQGQGMPRQGGPPVSAMAGGRPQAMPNRGPPPPGRTAGYGPRPGSSGMSNVSGL